MRRVLALLVTAFLCISLFPATSFAAGIDELLLFMGIKIEYVWVDPDDTDSLLTGQVSANTPVYSFTTKETSEETAEAVSNNHPMLTDGFRRQIPMRDLLKTLTAIKSAADILVSRGREDLLALAYLGGYVAPEHEYVSLDPEGSPESLVPVDDIDNIPQWARGGDVGQVGQRVPIPMNGGIRLRSVFGEAYTIGTNTFGQEEVVFDVPKDIDVSAIFNGYIAYIGSGIVETRSHDQRLIMRYNGIEPISGYTVGKVVTQGEVLGASTGYSVGISFSIDGVSRNLLQVYSEDTSKKWFDAWSERNVGMKERLVLGDGDSYYHIRSNELDANNPDSYTNPEMYGVNPALLNESDEQEAD